MAGQQIFDAGNRRLNRSVLSEALAFLKTQSHASPRDADATLANCVVYSSLPARDSLVGALRAVGREFKEQFVTPASNVVPENILGLDNDWPQLNDRLMRHILHLGIPYGIYLDGGFLLMVSMDLPSDEALLITPHRRRIWIRNINVSS